MKARVFSGIQPTGSPHIGNYLGALKNWVKIQGDYESIFGIVDLHAITLYQDPKELRAKILELAGMLLAIGIDHYANAALELHFAVADADAAKLQRPLGGGVETRPDAEAGPIKPQLLQPDAPAEQRADSELHAHRRGRDPRRVGGSDGDVGDVEVGNRQQPQGDRAADSHRRADPSGDRARDHVPPR